MGNFISSDLTARLAFNQETRERDAGSATKIPINAWRTLEFAETTRVPEPRSGHCAATSDCGNFLYIYGGFTTVPTRRGFSDLYSFHLASREWTLISPTTGECPVTTCSQSCVYFENKIYIFGGTGADFQSPSNNMYVCDLVTRHWQKVILQSDLIPTARFGQTLQRDKHDKFILFGGVTTLGFNLNEFFDDLWQFNPRERKWIVIPANFSLLENHFARYRHDAVLINASDTDVTDRMLVIGGGTPDTTGILDHVYSFDFTTKDWQLLRCRPDRNDVFPSARRSHTCQLFGRDIYMFGGTNGKAGPTLLYYQDVWTLNIDSLQWTNITEKFGQWPTPTFFHIAVFLQTNTLLIHGGAITDTLRTTRIAVLQLGVASLLHAVAQAVGRTRRFLPTDMPNKIFVPLIFNKPWFNEDQVDPDPIVQRG